MPKSRQKKESEVKIINNNLAQAKAVVFTSYTGLNVKDSSNLRNLLRKDGVTYVAAKKTLLKKAFNNNELPIEQMSGSLAVAFGQTDEVAPARVLAKFAKDKEALKILGGILEGAFIGADKVMALAKLPSKDELIAKTVYTIKAPITGFVNVLAGNLRGLVNVINAIKENK